VAACYLEYAHMYAWCCLLALTGVACNYCDTELHAAAADNSSVRQPPAAAASSACNKEQGTATGNTAAWISSYMGRWTEEFMHRSTLAVDGEKTTLVKNSAQIGEAHNSSAMAEWGFREYEAHR
jgi:hypothetical protein